MKSREWLRRTRERLSFAFSKTRLQEILQELTAFNSELESLYPDRPGPPSMAQGHQSSLKPHIEKAQSFRAIAEASQEAFQTLCGICSKHLEHRASLCVHANLIARDLRTAPHFEFEMIFARAGSRASLTRYEIKMIVNEIEVRLDQATSHIPMESSALKRQYGDSEPHSAVQNWEETKKVMLDVACSPINSKTATRSVNALVAPKDLCDSLCQWDRGKRQGQVALLTYSDVKWRKVISPIRTIPASEAHPTSLHQLISEFSQERKTGSLSDYQKVRLAKLLSLAFLRHHATDWGRPAWQSNNILFFEPCHRVEFEALRFPPPHIDIRICKDRDDVSVDDDGATEDMGARNMSLYRLGILFLEIAYLQIWDSLKQGIGRQTKHGAYAEFMQARKVSKLRLSGMPGQYHKIIEKLVECDFSQGDDLLKIELQAAFYQQVIDPLENLEKRLQAVEL